MYMLVIVEMRSSSADEYLAQDCRQSERAHDQPVEAAGPEAEVLEAPGAEATEAELPGPAAEAEMPQRCRHTGS